MLKSKLFTQSGKLALLCLIGFFLQNCANEEAIVSPKAALSNTVTTDETARVAKDTVVCSTCTYVVPANTNTIDGAKLGLKPGAVICLSAAIKYKNLFFKNLNGTATNPIVITNCGGTAIVDGTGLGYVMKTYTSKYFRITGGEGTDRGIQLKGGHLGLSLDYLSTNFEVDHIEVMKVGFAGIMAKTDPTCDDATIRGHFTMYDISLHDNYVHDTGGEGFYIGNSSYANGVKNSTCGIRMPHAIEGVKIYNNTVKNSSWESIQLGAATKRAEIYNNTIENYGVTNTTYQNNGIQIGEGTGGLCYNNVIKGGTGNGLMVLGLGDNVIHDNLIINAGQMGIFCDERYTPGHGFIFLNNTIVNSKLDGLRLYADLVPMNVCLNNIIVNPGNKVYVKTLSTNVKVDLANNYFTANINDVKFVNAGAYNYRLQSTSPAINKGRSIATYNIAVDFYKTTRLKGSAYDIGASEY